MVLFGKDAGRIKVPKAWMGVLIAGTIAVAAFWRGLGPASRDAHGIREVARLPGRYTAIESLTGSGRLLVAAALRDTLILLDVSRPESPERAFALPLEAEITSLAYGGARLFVATRRPDLRVFALSDSPGLVETGRTGSRDFPAFLAVRDSLVFLLEHDSGLAVLRLAGSGTPEAAGSADLPGASHLALHGKTALIGRGNRPVAVVDVSDPSRPVLVDSLPVPTHHPIALVGDQAFIADPGGGLWRADLSGRDSARTLTRIDSGPVKWAHALGDVLCVWSDGKLRFMAADDPRHLVPLDETRLAARTYALARVGEHLYLAARTPRSLQVLRVPALGR